jgi:hypothetical protein
VNLAEASRHPGQYGITREEEDLAILRELVDGMLIGFGEEPPVDGLVLAVQAASQPNYLGSPSVVQALVLPCIQAMVDGFSGKAGPMEWERQAELLVSAMTVHPDYTRMTWHSREQLGEELVQLMGLNPVSCSGGGLALVIQQALGAIHSATSRLWASLHQVPPTLWEPDGSEAFGRLTGFVVASFLGTASLGYAGKTLGDFVRRASPK